jgi:type VI secretion system protein ImpC
MRLLFIGNFSGRRTSDVASIEKRPTLRVDVDNFDQVLARLKPSVPLTLPGAPPVEVSMSTLDDFHPDRLLRQLAPSRALLDLRARLQNPSQFAEAAAELGLASPPASGTPAPPSQAQTESDAGAVERLLGGAPARGEAPATRTAAEPSNLEKFVRTLIAPHVVADTTSQQRAQFTAVVDATIGEHLRSVLHAPAFQVIESQWRGLRWLLNNLDLDDDLQIHLLDITHDELLADARAMHADPESSVLLRRLAQGPAAGGQRWSAFVVLFGAGASDDDMTWLSALGAIGALAGAPALATAGPSLLGLEAFEPLADPRDWPPVSGSAASHWQALRQSKLAPWIGLAAPRLLMRQPYGATTDPVESIVFEEFSATPEHEQLLWAPAALGCAFLLGHAFRDRGWEMSPGDVQQITDLPAYIVERDGERQLQPCAEVLMGERAALAVGERGLMALASYKDRAEVRLVRFQSVADPACDLSGPWS